MENLHLVFMLAVGLFWLGAGAVEVAVEVSDNWSQIKKLIVDVRREVRVRLAKATWNDLTHAGHAFICLGFTAYACYFAFL